MFPLVFQLIRTLRSPVSAPPEALPGVFSPAHALLENADLRAGLDPHQARQLRSAAIAWLSVVR